MPDDDVMLGRIREICGTFDGADESELQNRPASRVGRWRFAIFNGENSPPRPRWNPSGRSLHFASDPLERDALRQDDRPTTWASLVTALQADLAVTANRAALDTFSVELRGGLEVVPSRLRLADIAVRTDANFTTKDQANPQ